MLSWTGPGVGQFGFYLLISLIMLENDKEEDMSPKIKVEAAGLV